MMISLVEVCRLLLLLVVVDVCAAGECPTWFREAGDGTCECGSSLGSEIQCDNVTGHVSLALGYCMTYDNVSGEMQLVTGFTNYDYLGGGNRVYTTLPDDVTELNDFMCKNKSRHGFLCGECDPGYGAAINTLHSTCVECNSVYAVGMFILCAIFPMTIFCIIVIMFRLNILSGPMLGYIIFCQINIVTIRSNAAFFSSVLESMGQTGATCMKLSISLAGLWWYAAAVLFSFKPFCAHHGMSRLQVNSLEYAYVLYPLFLIFI